MKPTEPKKIDHEHDYWQDTNCVYERIRLSLGSCAFANALILVNRLLGFMNVKSAILGQAVYICTLSLKAERVNDVEFLCLHATFTTDVAEARPVMIGDEFFNLTELLP